MRLSTHHRKLSNCLLNKANAGYQHAQKAKKNLILMTVNKRMSKLVLSVDEFASK